jgi:hypothetical protein
VVENIVPDAPALCNAFRLVESPVNAEVNAALAVFFFRLRKRGKSARKEGTHDSVIAPRQPVEFVGDEGEGEPVGSVELSQRPGNGGVKLGPCRLLAGAPSGLNVSRRISRLGEWSLAGQTQPPARLMCFDPPGCAPRFGPNGREWARLLRVVRSENDSEQAPLGCLTRHAVGRTRDVVDFPDLPSEGTHVGSVSDELERGWLVQMVDDNREGATRICLHE